MRSLIIVLLISMGWQVIFAQTRRMHNNEQGRTFSVQHQSRTIWPLLQKAEQELRLFDFEASFFTLENAIAQNPYSAEALILRARLKQMVGMEAEAVTDLNLANRLNPYVIHLYGNNGNSGIMNILAVEPETAIQDLSVYQKLNYYYEALDRHALADDAPHEALLELESIVQLIEENNLDNALHDVNDIISKFPDLTIAYDLKGLILSKTGKIDEAMEAFSKAVTIEPGFAIAWYNMGRLEQKQGNFEQARIYLDRAINLQEDLTKAYFDRASVLKSLGEKEEALKDYDKIIDLNGILYTEAYVNRGLTKKMLGDFNGALADLDRIIDEFPDNPELLKNRGNLYLIFDLPQMAIDDYTSAIKLNPNYAEAYYNRALAHFIVYDNVSGCADMNRSATLNYEKAVEKKAYFCID